jgi:hypothetical protein
MVATGRPLWPTPASVVPTCVLDPDATGANVWR